MDHEHYQDNIHLLNIIETQAVQSMLLTSLRHGFLLDELIKLTKKYQTGAALVEYHDGDCIVNYATADGYFTRNFGRQYQQASDFVKQFDIWWYQ